MRISIIIIGFMVILFLIFAIHGIITFDLSIQEMKKLLSTRNESISFNMIQDIDQKIENRINSIQELINLDDVRDTLIESNIQFSNLLDVKEFLAIREQEIEFSATSDPFLHDVLDKELSLELQEIIEFYHDEYNFDVVEEIFVTNSYGANVALGSGFSDYRQDDEGWWKFTKENGFYIGKLEFDEKYDSNVVILGLKITDDSDNFLGVMRAVITLDDILSDFVDEAQLVDNSGRKTILLNEQGKIIFPNKNKGPIDSSVPSYFAKIQDGKNNGFFELEDLDDNVRLISYAKSTGFKSFEGTNWTIVIDQGSSTVVEEFIDLRNLTILISIVGIIASIIMGIIISKLISSPLKQYSKIAQSIAKGDFDITVNKSHLSELNIIGNTFEKMSKSLAKLVETETKLAEANVKVKNERLVAMGELAANVAHDLKNPLGIIKSTSDIVKRFVHDKDPELNKVLKRMDRATARMSHQIEDVLTLVRTTPVNLSKVSIRELLSSAKDAIDIPKNIVIEISDSTAEITCDSKKIEIVFINLILNAIQAIGNNQGKIHINIYHENDFYIIDFIDTGIGIPEQLLAKIFEPLVTTKEKGTGLGLSSCKNIIEQHRGTITAKNNPTTFSVKLPY